MYSSGMKLRCFVLFVAFGAAACAGRPAIGPFLGDEENSKGTKWAMLVAGSAGWGNYRHQADICHAYQVLKAGGLKDENIVVMMADDLVSNQMNPHPGQIFNKPNGPDVYEGVLKDYTGSTVTAANVLKVLAGDAEAMEGVGSGKVPEKKPVWQGMYLIGVADVSLVPVVAPPGGTRHEHGPLGALAVLLIAKERPDCRAPGACRRSESNEKHEAAELHPAGVHVAGSSVSLSSPVSANISVC